MEEETTITAIHRLIQEMDETRAELKVLREQLKSVLEQNDEYRELQEEVKVLAAKRAEAKKLLLTDRDYQTVSSQHEEVKFKLRDLQEIMSHHLVSFYNETRETQIKDPAGEVRQVILSAKIGRPEMVVNE